MPYGTEKCVFLGRGGDLPPSASIKFLHTLKGHYNFFLNLKIQVGQAGKGGFCFVSVWSLLGLAVSGEKKKFQAETPAETDFTPHLEGPGGLQGPARIEFWGLKGTEGCLESSFPFIEKLIN